MTLTVDIVPVDDKFQESWFALIRADSHTTGKRFGIFLKM
jgi:hypothetical protein